MENTELIKRLTVVKTKISMDHAFWAVIILHIDFVLNESLGYLGATDCAKTIMLNPLLVAKLGDPEFIGLIMHELLHIVFMHEMRRFGRNHELWNIAADYAVNSVIIDEMGYKIPKGGLYDKRFMGKSAEEIYDILYDEQMKEPQTGQGAESEAGSDGQGQPQEQDGNGSGSQKKTKQGKGKSKGSGSGTSQGSPEAGSGGSKKSQNKQGGAGGGDGVHSGRFDSHMPVPAGGEADVKDMVATAQAVWESMASEGRGTLPGTMLEHLNRLLNPRVPWEREFQKYSGETLCRDDFSWSPPNRRYLVHDIYMPSCRAKKIGNLVVAIDSSGSIGTRELEAFAAETAKLASIVDECILIVADHEVQQVVKTSEVPAFLRKLDFKGRGGTSHVPVFEKVKELRLDPELLIALTDGDTSFPDRKPGYPVLWCMTEKEKTIPFGKQIYVDVREY